MRAAPVLRPVFRSAMIRLDWAKYAWFAETHRGCRVLLARSVRTHGGCMTCTATCQGWCADWYGDHYYYEESPVDDPKGPASGSCHVNRGGGWFNTAGFRSADRYAMAPPYRYGTLGFRVVAVPFASPASPASDTESDRHQAP